MQMMNGVFKESVEKSSPSFVTIGRFHLFLALFQDIFLINQWPKSKKRFVVP